MRNAAFSSNKRKFSFFICVSASTSPAEKLSKFRTRETSDEEEIGRSLCSANQEVISPGNMKPSSITQLFASSVRLGTRKKRFKKWLLRFRPSEAPSSRLSSRRSSAGHLTTQAGGVSTDGSQGRSGHQAHVSFLLPRIRLLWISCRRKRRREERRGVRVVAVHSFIDLKHLVFLQF